MGLALTTGVTGLQASQQMLDVAGNNLANINTTAFKASTVSFSELLSQTIKSASQPTTTIGGTNPQQIGSGVGIAGITPNMAQGNIVSTSNPLDLAIDGNGYFVLNDGQQNVFTRIGAFGVDSDSALVDPATGCHVQRIGSEGELDGFQIAGDSNIHLPYNTTLPANATSTMMIAGNLRATSVGVPATKQLLDSDCEYTVDGNGAQGDSKISDLDQFKGDFASGQTGTITITGTQRDGTAISAGNTLAVDANTTMSDLLAKINSLLTDSTASLTATGNIQIVDKVSGYSKTDIKLAYAQSTGGTDQMTMPGYFKILTAGGNDVQNVNISIVDSIGGKHTLNAAFVRTDTLNTWDMVLTSVSGDISALTTRRIEGITFNSTTGAYNGLSDAAATSSFGINFAFNPSATQTIGVELGTVGNFDGITQFDGSSSTAKINKQDGYVAGQLSSLSVGNDGIIVGAFSNGVKKNIATIQMALFQNPGGLESVGKGYYVASANSGEGVATYALNGGAGKIQGGSLEKSNVDVATEFVNMIEAQNSYQANARTISVATTIMNTLTNLIR